MIRPCPVRMVFSDMDGTFLTSQKQVAPATWSALDRLAERGIAFVPCTGRAFGGIPVPLVTHPATRFAVTANGAAVFEVDAEGNGARIHHETMTATQALEVYDLVRGTDDYFDFFVNGRIYVGRRRYELLGRYVPDAPMLAYMRSARAPIDDDEVLGMLSGPDGVEKISIFCSDASSRARMTDYLACHDDLASLSSYNDNIEVTSATATKGNALVLLCERAGIDISSSVAFGDAMNDSTMLVAAGDGVAMGNASEEVKGLSNHVTATNDEDGVARYLSSILA